MEDLFHMNIEERNHVDVLRKIAPYLVHVHIADNNKEAAGLGQTDFKPAFGIMSAVAFDSAQDYQIQGLTDGSKHE